LFSCGRPKGAARDWDMSGTPREYVFNFEVNHIFKAGHQIIFSAGIGHTSKGREAVVLFDAQQTGRSGAHIPWQDEWPMPPPPEEGGPRIALITTTWFQDSVIDDLEYLGYSFDLYTELNILTLFENKKIYDYDAVLVSSAATWDQIASYKLRVAA
jgi:hypothetical protein